ncbi:hypothetical protein ACN38_g428 [Penicillium nordicum]|uniref:Uncharacterized protein n=1 Tax=Penicillium nordicum TaxID=229535 RepID=A0A0N0S046_9EURO|nr:hypothetical protein ACN38_g428 [Penicillium nordicum]
MIDLLELQVERYSTHLFFRHRSANYGFKGTLTDALIGAIGTPNLNESKSCKSIPPSFQTPQGSRVNVIHITWQFETKRTAWFASGKHSGFLDLVFLFTRYGQFLDKNMRQGF